MENTLDEDTEIIKEDIIDIKHETIEPNMLTQHASSLVYTDTTTSFFEEALKKIKKEIIDDEIGLDNLVITIIKLIQIVEKYNSLNGLQKKTLVLKVIRKHIENSKSSEKDRQNMIYIVDQTGSQIIDTIIFASKGKLFKDLTNKLSKMISCCYK